MSTLWILGKSFPRDTQKWKEALLMWLEVALADWETAWQNANSLSPVCCTKWHFRGKGRGGVSDSLCPQRVAAICDQRFIPIKSEVVSSTSFELGKDSEIFPIWIPPSPQIQILEFQIHLLVCFWNEIVGIFLRKPSEIFHGSLFYFWILGMGRLLSQYSVLLCLSHPIYSMSMCPVSLSDVRLAMSIAKTPWENILDNWT